MDNMKFRIWMNNKYRYYGFLRDGIGNNLFFSSLPSDNKDTLSMEEALSRTQQFTGLLDKNGKEIYEGDILRYNYHIVYDENWKGSRENNDFFGIVEYHDKILKIGYESDETRFVGFIMKGCPNTEQEYFTTIPILKDIEIVGNIYENPELIKDEVTQRINAMICKKMIN
jgi:uncharacterized phage protein (TIGR01671 family)